MVLVEVVFGYKNEYKPKNDRMCLPLEVIFYNINCFTNEVTCG